MAVAKAVLSEAFCLELEIVVIPSGTTNKPGLINNYGEIASALFEAEHCGTVAIIGDLIPTWGGPACRKDDVEAITQNLLDSNVNMGDVKLMCIESELEDWLFVDGEALTHYKRDRCHPHKIRKFDEVTLSPHSDESKKKISKYPGWRYNDITEAIRIVKNITRYDRIAHRHESFARLKTFIEQICPQ